MLHDAPAMKMSGNRNGYAADEDVNVNQVDTTETETEMQGNDALDDIFGSAPSSPSFPAHAAGEGDGNAYRERQGGNSNPNSDLLSDIPRLREKHETEGYRDGVTKGKAGSVQGGFDEGYSLGATLGLRVGRILGILEGVWRGVLNMDGNGEWEGEKARLETLWVDAKAELETSSVFAREWWEEDGVWRFEVPGEGEGEGKGEVLFPDVAAAHPLLVKWEEVVRVEVERWGLDLKVLEGEENDAGKVEEMEIEKEKEASTNTARGAAKELAW